MFKVEDRRTKRNQREGAAALRYDPLSNSAPQVVAKGKGLLAAKIIEEAKHHEIPIVTDQLLFDILYQLEIGSEIPGEIYEPVAKVLSFLYTMHQKYREMR